MRKADQEKQTHSYTAEFDSFRQKFVIKEHSWLPGYSAAHKATPEEAIEYQITKAEREIEAAKQRILALTLLKENN